MIKVCSITGAWSSILISLLNPKTENLTMSLRSDIVSFWFWGYRGDIKTELQAPVVLLENKHFKWIFTLWKQHDYQISGFTVSKATINCMLNTNVHECNIWWSIFLALYILTWLCLEFWRCGQFWEFVFHISSTTDFIYGIPFWAIVG